MDLYKWGICSKPCSLLSVSFRVGLYLAQQPMQCHILEYVELVVSFRDYVYNKLNMIFLYQVIGAIDYVRARMVGSNLSIINIEKKDHGMYECEARNDYTRIVTQTRLIVESKITLHTEMITHYCKLRR